MLETLLLANLALVALNHHQIMHDNFCLQVRCGWFWRIHEAPSLLFLATAFLLGLRYCKQYLCSFRATCVLLLHNHACSLRILHTWLNQMAGVALPGLVHFFCLISQCAQAARDAL